MKKVSPKAVFVFTGVCFLTIAYWIVSWAKHPLGPLAITMGNNTPINPSITTRLLYFVTKVKWLHFPPNIGHNPSSCIVWVDKHQLLAPSSQDHIVPVITDEHGCLFLPEHIGDLSEEIVPIEFLKYPSGTDVFLRLYNEPTNGLSFDRDAFLTNAPIRIIGPFVVASRAPQQVILSAPGPAWKEGISVICFKVPHGIQMVFDIDAPTDIIASSIEIRDRFGNISSDGRNICWKGRLDVFANHWNGAPFLVSSDVSVSDCLESGVSAVLQKSSNELQITNSMFEPRSFLHDLTNDSHHDDIYLPVPKDLQFQEGAP
jgi:hypothetical protein